MTYGKRTHCPAGHPYGDAFTRDGYNDCRTCRNARAAARRDQHRQLRALVATLEQYNAQQRRCRDAYHATLDQIHLADYRERLAIRTSVQDTAA